MIADEGQMKQVFLNLLLNAVDAMPQGGYLRLVTRNIPDHKIMVVVSDTGVGIPQEKVSQIFEPFFTTKQSGAGVGLGLAVVQGIIRDHNGSISVNSVLGQGTTFIIKLPAFKQGEEHVAS